MDDNKIEPVQDVAGSILPNLPPWLTALILIAVVAVILVRYGAETVNAVRQAFGGTAEKNLPVKIPH